MSSDGRAPARDGAVLGVPGVVALQRLAGNRATRSLVRAAPAEGPGAHAGALVVQRAPAFGLATPAATNEFAKTAVRWWRSYPKTRLSDFALILVAEASSSLEKIGVPSVDIDPATPSGAAVFHASSWTIGVNVKATGFSPDTKIGDMPAKDLADFADTFFHEARHAEQRFLVARLAVARSPGKDAKAIAEEVFTTERIGAAAIKAGGALSGPQKAKAEQLAEFMDHHVGYKMWNNGVRDAASALYAALPDPSRNPSGVDSISAAFRALAPKVEPLRKELASAATRIATLEKQAKRSAVDEQVLRDLRGTRAALEDMLAKAAVVDGLATGWPAKKAANPKMTVDDAKGIQSEFNLRWLELVVAVGKLDTAASGAYERYPEEADSRTVGGAVATATLRAATAPRTPARSVRP